MAENCMEKVWKKKSKNFRKEKESREREREPKKITWIKKRFAKSIGTNNAYLLWDQYLFHSFHLFLKHDSIDENKPSESKWLNDMLLYFVSNINIFDWFNCAVCIRNGPDDASQNIWLLHFSDWINIM